MVSILTLPCHTASSSTVASLATAVRLGDGSSSMYLYFQADILESGSIVVPSPTLDVMAQGGFHQVLYELLL